ncbi:MAG: PQQ-binding-like beta-propeller repeat protein, partial [Thermomicrobiales bacterium]
PQLAPRARPASPVLAQALLALLLVAALVAGSLTMLRQRDQRAAAPLLATPAATTPSDWPMYRGNPARSGYTSTPGPDGQPVILWQYTAGGTAWRSPAVAGGVAYLQSGDGMVTALDAASGAVRWQVALGSASDTPSIVGDTLYVNTGGGNLVALDAATGAERWRFAQHVAAGTTPLVVDGVAYTGSDDGEVFALDAATGEQLWSATVGGAISRSLALGDGRLVVPTAVGAIVALEAATGKEQWRVTGEKTSDFVGTPAMADGEVYFGLSGELHAVNAATGEEAWSIPYSGTPSSAGNEVVVSSDAEGVVHAFDAATGAERWSAATTGVKVQAAALLAADTAYVATFDHALYAFDLATGSERWSLELDGASDFGPSLADGVLYIGTDAGTLYAIGGSGTAQLTAPLAATAAAATPEPTAAPVSALAIPTEVTEPALVHIWTRSKLAGDFTGATGALAIDPFSRIWLCNTNDGTFDIFDRDGNTLQHIDGGAGSEPGQWDWTLGVLNQGPFWVGCAITFAPDGTAYVTDGGNQRVQVLGPDGAVQATWSTADPDMPQLKGPIGISRLANGELLVTDFADADVIRRFSADGQFLGMFNPAEGVVETVWDPVNTLVDADGAIWVTEMLENRVVKLTPEGELLLAIGGPNAGTQPGQFSEPTGVAVDAEGDIYVADDDNRRLQVFAPDGAFLAEFTGAEAGIPRFGEQGGGVGNIVSGGSGYFYLTDYADDDFSGDERLMKLQILLPADAAATPAPS